MFKIIPKTISTVILVLSFSYSIRSDVGDLVEYYENLINIASVNALAYEPPEDASIYQANDYTAIDFGTFDFVVIGAGSTGCVIANRLSEERRWRVLLLEAGNFSNELNDIPGLFTLSVLSDYNWGFRSVPQTTACLGTVNQRCPIPRGKGIGGTSLINGLVYSRSNPRDYDEWAEITNDPSWSYNHILRYLKKSEDFHKTDPEAPVDWRYHGLGGELYVEHGKSSIDLKYVFLEGSEELGYDIRDYNSPLQIGASVLQFNTKVGKRHDQGSAFILPIINRDNLLVQTESYVTKININRDTKVATGCTFTHKGKTYTVTANKEVILSAGVISSPQILMLSGIGPREHLEDLGIPVIQNLPVGYNLQDHVAPFGVQFTSNMTAPKQTLTEKIVDYLNGAGSLSISSHVVGFYMSSAGPKNGRPDLEVIIDLSGTGSVLGQKFQQWKNETYDDLTNDNLNVSFYINMKLLRPRSVGNVKLKSSSPFDYPLVDYNLLSDPAEKDIDTLYEAIQISMKLINTTAFRKVEAEFARAHLSACSDFEYLSKDYWYCYLRQTVFPTYHPVGSCSTGTDPAHGAVVDSDLKVFGVNKLRVADTSVIPFTLSGHPHATCTLIGEKISDVIKSTYSLH